MTDSELLCELEEKLDEILFEKKKRRSKLEVARDASLTAGGLSVAAAGGVAARRGNRIGKDVEAITKNVREVTEVPKAAKKKLRTALMKMGLRFKP
jgi:hypothetical protein